MLGGRDMVGERRRARAEARLRLAEAEYEAALSRALERCAAGVWGLFGQNAPTPGALAPKEAGALLDLGANIGMARAELGLPAFDSHQRFVALRGRQSENSPGEPKLARALIDQLMPKA